MAEPTSDPLTWVSLGSDDIEPGGLALTGEPWDQVLPAGDDNRIDPALMTQMPRDGWRELVSPNRRDLPHASRLFAAPNGDGWALAHLSGNAEGSILSGDLGPYRVRPGRPSRRRGLQLTWPEGIRCAASDLSRLSVTLRNTSVVPWRWDPEDSGYVHAWLLDDQGERLAPSWFAYGPLQYLLTDLGPDESIALDVDFGPSADDQVQPGSYAVEAVLPALDLWTPKSALDLT